MGSQVARVASITTIVLSAVATASVWRSPVNGQASPKPLPVQLLGRAAPPPPANDPSDRGATYYSLEGLARRQTTSFGDAVAVTERVPGGDLHTRVTDKLGNEVAAMHVDRVRPGVDILEFRPPSGTPLRAAGGADVNVTLDWSNRQAYALWKDHAAGPVQQLEWRDGHVRAAGARPGAQPVVEHTTLEWPDEMVATTRRTVGQRKHVTKGTPLRGTTLESRLTRRGQQIGVTRWFADEQVYAWSIPGRSEGYLDPERLVRNNGWQFTPDAAWVNVQTYAFEYFGEMIAERGFVASTSPEPGWLDRLANAIVPTLSANTAGCDGLHWLDGSVLRYCCDLHDYCYEKYSCDYTSWWRVWTSWQCDYCNMSSAFCFLTIGRPRYMNSSTIW